MRILIVDDEQRICKSWRNLLTRATVIAAASAGASA